VFRFIALAWTPDATAQSATSQIIARRLLESDSAWRCVLDAVGLQVFCNGTQPGLDSALCLANKRGVVVGSIFKKPADGTMDYASAVSSFGASKSEEILASKGRMLTRSYWGWYVAFLTDTPVSMKCVVKGPMSEMQCFHVGLRGVHIMFSWIEDIVQLGLVDLTIDWDHITLHSEFGYATRIGESALNEVTPLTSGQCMELFEDGSVTATTYWDPCKIANSTWLGSEASAVEAVHATTRSCVEAWASFHNDIILRLSGGLDSAIVMSCLRSARHSPRTTSVNYFTLAPLGDERRYARAMSLRAKVELIERELGYDNSLGVITRAGRKAAPSQDSLMWEIHAGEQNLARDRSATAIFMGTMGDGLFETSTYLSPAADYLAQHGIGSRFIKVVLDVAEFHRVSAWRVIAEAIRDGWFSIPKGSLNRYVLSNEPRAIAARTGLTRNGSVGAILSVSERFIPLWLREIDGVPPGKLWMIFAMIADSLHQSPFRQPDDAPFVSPFISQPLIELCLRIPTYMNLQGGWNRAVARRAFANDLPNEIIGRSTKGTSGLWLKSALDRNWSFAREYLLDGALVQRGVLDRKRLEKSLSGSLTKDMVHGAIVTHLIYTEAWIQQWSHLPHRAAA
jgi:asparagine synthase (glutamine-hydrolysing)